MHFHYIHFTVKITWKNTFFYPSIRYYVEIPLWLAICFTAAHDRSLVGPIQRANLRLAINDGAKYWPGQNNRRHPQQPDVFIFRAFNDIQLQTKMAIFMQ